MKIRFDRLERVAAYLARKMESSAFNMCNWHVRWQKPTQGQCGFAGCAMGWVAHRKMFRGFKLEPIAGGVASIPHYQGADGFVAVAKLFGIAIIDAEDLFGPSPHETPKSVARRIRAFVREKKAKVAA